MASTLTPALPLPRPSRSKRGWALNGFGTAVLLVMALFVLYPLALLIYGSFIVEHPDGSQTMSLGAWAYAWTQPGIGQSIVNTFKIVITLEVVALPTAILIAWLVARTDIPGKRLIDNFFWIAFFLPALPVLLGWIFLFDPDYGVVNALLMNLFDLRDPPFNIYSFWGIIFAHLAARSIAAKYIFMTPAFRNFDSSFEEASRIAGCSTLRTIWRILIPILMPAILITLAISLTHALESFEIELILGPPFHLYVFSTKMYQLVSGSPPMFNAATVLGLSVLLIVLPLILWQQRLLSKRSFVTVTSHFQVKPLQLRGWRWAAFGVLATLGVCITVVPVICLLMGTFMNLFGQFNLDKVWTLDHWQSVLSDPLLIQSAINTLILAGSAALVGVIWFSIVAYVSVRTKYVGRRTLDFMTWLPATLPGIILGLGLLWMFLTVPLLQPFYGTIIILVVAVLINAVTTGVQLIKSNMIQLGNDLEEASFVAGASWLYTFRRIVMPILGPVLISVALLIFSSAARNVSNIVMIVTGDNRPLAMLQIDYMTDGQYEPAAIVGVLIVLLTFGVAVAARAISRKFGYRTT
jgi:iron(III) transport system permease protein